MYTHTALFSMKLARILDILVISCNSTFCSTALWHCCPGHEPYCMSPMKELSSRWWWSWRPTSILFAASWVAFLFLKHNIYYSLPSTRSEPMHKRQGHHGAIHLHKWQIIDNSLIVSNMLARRRWWSGFLNRFVGQGEFFFWDHIGRGKRDEFWWGA